MLNRLAYLTIIMKTMQLLNISNSFRRVGNSYATVCTRVVDICTAFRGVSHSNLNGTQSAPASDTQSVPASARQSVIGWCSLNGDLVRQMME